MMFWLLLLLLLSGCASIQPPVGMECDPSGACWPDPLPAVTREYVVEYLPQKEIREKHSELKGAESNAIAFTHLAVEPAVIYLPTELTRRQIACGWSLPLLKRHELGHLSFSTAHGVVKKVRC